MSHKQTAIKGITWLSFNKIAAKIFSATKLIIFARFLSPETLGTVGLSYMGLSMLQIFTETGFAQAAIQDKKDLEPKLTTIWMSEIFRGFLVAGLLFTLSGFIDIFFNVKAQEFTKILALSSIISSFANPNIISMQRNLAFKRSSVFQTATSLLENISTIIFVFLLKSPYALVYGSLVGAIFRTLGSFIVVRFYFSKFDFQILKKLFQYGRWVTGGSILTYLNDQIDDFTVAKLLGAGQLGYYQTAYKISNLPTTESTGLLYQVFFPIFSSIDSKKKDIDKLFNKVIGLSLLISGLFIVGIIIVAPLFVDVFMGSNWRPILPALYILSVFGFLRANTSLAVSIFDANNLPSVAFKSNLIKFVILSIIVVPMTLKFSYLGTAASVSISQAVVVPWLFVQIRNLVGKINEKNL